MESNCQVFCLSLLVFLNMQYLSEAAVDCINGNIVSNYTCACFLGWMGDACDKCGSRIRLTNSSGVIADDVSGSQYSGDTQCMFFIETDRPTSKIHLRLRLLHTECQWDYLHVFDGDSAFAQKLAAYTGNVIEQMDPTAVNSSIPFPNPQPVSFVLSSTGPQLLVYFYTDMGTEADGFEIDYWMDYACPFNCSDHGKCKDNGTCQCDTGWYGDLCDLSVCPNNCSSNGECDADTRMCHCSLGYEGMDCSLDVNFPFWSRVTYSRLPVNITLSTLARASHSAVLWRDDVLIFSGYQLAPEGYSFFSPLEHEKFRGDASGIYAANVFQYHIESGSWKLLMTSSNMSGNDSVPLLPTQRYGHSAVVYNDTMYVFGGAKWPSEEIVNELWALNFNTQLWTSLSDFHPLTMEHDNSTLIDSDVDIISMTSFQSNERTRLPLPVRSHTAHVIGSKMIILFGLSSGTETFISYVQEYDFDTGKWSAPPQTGLPVSGRMGHASIYNPETKLIYVEGGVIQSGEITSQLLTYNPELHLWSNLSASGSPHYLHTMSLFGPLLLVFGGCQGDRISCYTSEITIYNILCDTWKVVEYDGLPVNSSRYGHSAILHQSSNSLFLFGGFFGTLHHDMLQLHIPNCSIHQTKYDCLHLGDFCAWSGGEQGHCVSVVEADGTETASHGCDTNFCSHFHSCGECNQQEQCHWLNETLGCVLSNLSNSTEYSNTQNPTNLCSDYRYCESCYVHGCLWNGSHCYSQLRFKELNLNPSTCLSHPCSLASSCEECTGNKCLWCPSLQNCIHASVYPYLYSYGQCLGWVSQSSSCFGNCSDYKTCSNCQSNPYCGWCNDPSDTGLGECSEGGFTTPRNTSYCVDYGDDKLHERWFFEVCPACQCNGHSSCVNTSICEDCQNNTDGSNCAMCRTGFWGDSHNGGTCQECDCNGYNSFCDLNTGVCECLSFGVTGNHCEQCDTLSNGDANNFCFAEMQVNFIYTYSVEMDREQEGFFIVTPPEDKNLNFKFEITLNPTNQLVNLQLFVGKKSENLWVLTNLTDSIVLAPIGSHKQSFNSFTSNSNSSLAQLYSFARPSIRQLPNFTNIFNSAVENDYTNSMWDGDTSLVIYIFNLTTPMRFRITVDQQDFLFLLYFFITFITCFSVLLTAFLLGWYIRQKIMVRNILRQQFLELQRRVARPFARMKLQIGKLSTAPENELQASYVGVETCKINKAAILSLFVRLPGNTTNGRPVVGRSGLCIGSTLVKVNPSKKSKGNNKEYFKVSKGKNFEGRSNCMVNENTSQQSGEVYERMQRHTDSTSPTR